MICEESQSGPCLYLWGQVVKWQLPTCGQESTADPDVGPVRLYMGHAYIWILYNLLLNFYVHRRNENEQKRTL